MIDFKEFQNPLKQYVEDSIDLNLVPNYENEAVLSLQTAKSELLDHIFKYWEKVSYKFVEIVDVMNSQYIHTPGKDKVLGTVRLKLSSKSAIYGRVADSIFNGLEATGGFYESIYHLGVMLVFFFQERLFKSSFLRQLYQVPSQEIKPV
jgi:hypothetical protein